MNPVDKHFNKQIKKNRKKADHILKKKQTKLICEVDFIQYHNKTSLRPFNTFSRDILLTHFLPHLCSFIITSLQRVKCNYKKIILYAKIYLYSVNTS